MAARFWTSENLSIPYAGKATQITVDIHEHVTEDDLLQDFGELKAPFVLIYPAQVEGTDFPFYSRQRIDDPEDYLWRDMEQDLFQPQADVGTWPLILPGTPPDETPLFIGGWRSSSNQDEVLADWQSLADGEPREDTSDWFLPFELGGTVYGGNLCQLMNEIQRHLLEHEIDEGLTWSLWTREEVLQMIYQRIDDFLHETGLTRRRNTVDVLPEEFEIQVPADVLQIRRVTWSDAQGRVTLPKIDPWSLDNFSQTWENDQGRPLYYIEQPMVTKIIRLVPEPLTAGVIELSYVAKPVAVDNCDALPLPMMWIPYIKYGVMADMLSKEGEANDPERALHFELRWDEGVELAKSFLGVEF